MKTSQENLTRRNVLFAAATLPLALLTHQHGAVAQTTAPIPACSDATPESEEGPFFKPGSPQRSSFVAEGTPGTTLSLTGVVRSTACQPIRGARLDFWHADSSGHYDTNGFHMRGHQYSDDQGRYRLETILPGAYPGRTRHIHVKLQRPGGKLLTTELYFPDEPRNSTDDQFTAALLMEVIRGADSHREARFDFVMR